MHYHFITLPLSLHTALSLHTGFSLHTVSKCITVIQKIYSNSIFLQKYFKKVLLFFYYLPANYFLFFDHVRNILLSMHYTALHCISTAQYLALPYHNSKCMVQNNFKYYSKFKIFCKTNNCWICIEKKIRICRLSFSAV